MPKNSFSWKFINFVALVLFISFNIVIRYKENATGDDSLMQIASAQALRQGYGVSILYADSSDLAQVSPRVVEFWPPGYAVLAAAFLQVTDNVRFVHLFIDALGVILFFLAWYVIALRLICFTAPYFPSLLLLPWAFGFMLRWLPATDLLATALFICSMACLLSWIAHTNRTKKQVWLTLCAFAAFGACFIRFAYYPTAFVPAILLLTGAVIYRTNWWRPAIFLSGLTILLIGAQILYQHFIAGSVNYVSQRHAASQLTIHWYNLQQFTPFVTKSIPGASLLPFSESFTDWLLLLVLCIGCLSMLRITIRHNTYEEQSKQLLYGWLGLALLSFLVNILFMIFLSLRYPPEAWGPWTYVQEIRYFGLNMAIVSSLLVFLLFWKDWPFSKYGRYALKTMAVVIFLYSYAFGLFKIRANEKVYPNESLQTASAIQQWVKDSPRQVVFISDQVHNYWDNVPVTSMGMYGAMAGASIGHIQTLLKPYHCSQPITVLVAIVYAPPPGLEELYRSGNAQQVGTIGQNIPLMRLTLPATRPVSSLNFR